MPADSGEETNVPMASAASESGLTRRRVAAKSISRDDDDKGASMVQIVHGIENLAKHVHPAVPNPAPLGLIAFGFTTCLLQMKHTRIAGSTTDEMAGANLLVLGFEMFFGGFIQIVAGISEIRRNNIFGYTAFCVYGAFWMSMGTVSIVSLLATNAPPVNLLANQAMLFLLGVTSTMLWVLTFKLNKTICSLFFLLLLTCFFLSFGVHNKTVDIIGGYLGIITSANAFWLAFVELVNDVIGEGREILPLGHWNWNQFRGAGAVHVPGRIRGHRLSQIERVPDINVDDHVVVNARDVEKGDTSSEESPADHRTAGVIQM